MSTDAIQLRAVHFAEQMGIMFEQLGHTRIAGRLLGWLVVCAPPEQSSAQLADTLNASRGSISTGTRSLLAAGLIEKVRFPGDRSTYFKIRPGVWQRTLQAKLASFTLFREAAERGLQDLRAAGSPEPQLDRLRDLHDTYAFFEREMPAMIQRFHDARSPGSADDKG